MLTRLLDLGGSLAIYKAHVSDVDEQDINAQVMPPEMFERLTETIRRDGRLEALPFGVLRTRQAGTEQGGKVDKQVIEMISGHHRLRAARTAGIQETFFLVDERDLDRSAVVAKQLAHNKIHGESDPQTLKRLFDEIKSVADMAESYIKPEDFDGIKQLDGSSIPEVTVALDYRRISFVFLASELKTLDAVDRALAEIPKKTDLIGVIDLALFDRFKQAALALGRTHDVRSMGVLVAMMVEAVEATLPQADAAADGAG